MDRIMQQTIEHWEKIQHAGQATEVCPMCVEAKFRLETFIDEGADGERLGRLSCDLFGKHLHTRCLMCLYYETFGEFCLGPNSLVMAWKLSVDKGYWIAKVIHFLEEWGGQEGMDEPKHV